MKLLLLKYKYLIVTFVISFVIFYPSLFVFYANDDFYFLKLAQVNTVSAFLNFFNLVKGPDGFGMYRPLTTQFYYFLGEKLFNYNPLYLHIIDFIFYFGVVFLVYRLILKISTDKKIATIAIFLYSVSAVHYGHLYYLAVFQEVAMSFFVLLSILAFFDNKKFISYIAFVLALTSKETAVVVPLLIGAVYWYQNINSFNFMKLKKILISLSPFFVVIFLYLFLRLFYYGFVKGDTYIWDFSIHRLVNSLFWYFVWSFNLPESLIDFVGPGLKINANLFVYWGQQIMPILVFFIVQLLFLVYALIRKIKSRISSKYVFLSAAIFCIPLLPVIFLPEHKFTYYLTLPLIGVVYWLSNILVRHKTFFIGSFIGFWLAVSLLTIKFSVQTNWITQSELAASRVFNYFNMHANNLVDKNIYLVDTQADSSLPWSPTAVVKTILSDKNFFDVYYPNISARITYAGLNKIPTNKNSVIINSRQFLGY